MGFKDDLIRKGYFPENLPPAFCSDKIASSIANVSDGEWCSHSRRQVLPATYNASKRGLGRRTFSFVHPETIHDLAKFSSERWEQCQEFFDRTPFSISKPRYLEKGNRAIEISSYKELEVARLNRLAHYRYIAKTDISRFYHSIYTHAIPWAFHGKSVAKADRNSNSAKVFFNRADHILRCGQDGQTVGIPVGPDTSRILAEVVATAIDLEFNKHCDAPDFDLVRHVDDVWIGTHTQADAERVLWKYREAIREFELDVNESKTCIYSSDFQFGDRWPHELSSMLGTAFELPHRQGSEHLRAALEYAFQMAVRTADDGVLRYVIRYIDRFDIGWSHWASIEPFLKRAVVHFGHTVDYVTRVIVWRHLTSNDLDISIWSKILTATVARHGKTGNDSEVCWAIYACARLQLPISDEIAADVIRNCGALSLVALLNCVEKGLVSKSAFKYVSDRMTTETACGRFWPVLLEWKSRRWSKAKLRIENDLVESMISQGVILFNYERLPAVFDETEPGSFDDVSHAIETGISAYEEEEVQMDEDDDSPF